MVVKGEEVNESFKECVSGSGSGRSALGIEIQPAHIRVDIVVASVARWHGFDGIWDQYARAARVHAIVT